MKKYWIIILISFFLSITFLIFYNSVHIMKNNANIDINQYFIRLKIIFNKTMAIFDENRIILEKFPDKEINMEDLLVAKEYTKIVNDIKSSDNSVIGVNIINEENKNIAGINKSIVDHYISNKILEDINLSNDIINIVKENDNMIIIKKITNKEGKFIGKLFILYKDELFNNINYINFKDIKIFCIKDIENYKVLLKNYYDEFINIFVPINNTSIKKIKKDIIIYKTKINQNEEIYYIDKMNPVRILRLLFFMVIISLSVFALSIVLIITNNIINMKNERLDRYNIDLIDNLS